jgi:hypothetical protein
MYARGLVERAAFRDRPIALFPYCPTALAKQETGRAIRAWFGLWVALIVSNQRRALRAPRGDRYAAGLG